MFHRARAILSRIVPLALQVAGAAVLGGSAMCATAGEQANRALASIKLLQDIGEIAPGTVLNIAAKQGNVAAFLGMNSELEREWEARTGIPINTTLMPQVDSQPFIERIKPLDLAVARTHEYPDLFQRDLIEDLAPLMSRFGFSLAADSRTGYMLAGLQAYVGERIAAVPADADIPVLYLRKDLLEDPANQARYRERFKRNLVPPTTWSEYKDQVAFFHRPQDEFFGSLEQRDLGTAWMFWMPRFVAHAPAPFLFDEQMRPRINSPAGIAATENYLSLTRYMAPAALAEGRDYSYTLPLFKAGKGYSTISTQAGAKLFNQEGSAVKGKFISMPLPGYLRDGKLQRSSMLIYGNNLVIPKSSRNKALALLFAMWLTDPDTSIRAVGIPGSFADPYRFHHLRDERLRNIYTAQTLDLIAQELAHVIPGGTGLPGNSEYLAALNDNLYRAAQGKQTARQAMARTARAWDAITHRYGREQQIRHWQAYRRQSPGHGGAPLDRRRNGSEVN